MNSQRTRFGWWTLAILVVFVSVFLFRREESPEADPPASTTPSPSDLGTQSAPLLETSSRPQREPLETTKPTAAPAVSSPQSKTATLTVRILDGATRRARMDVTLTCSSGPFVAHPKADANGSFTVEEIPVPSRLLCEIRTARGSLLTRSVDIRTTGATSTELFVEPLTPFAGRVIDRTSAAPIEGATIEVSGGQQRRSEGSMAALASARTDSDGRFEFEIESDAASAQPRLIARAEGYCEAVLRGITPRELAIALLPGAALEGTVVDEQGRPVPDADLTIRCRESIEPESLGLSSAEFAELRRAPQARKTDAAGRFQCTGLLPEQEHTITLEDMEIGLLSDELPQATAKLGPAGSVTTVRIEKRAPEAPGAIEGILRYNGKPAPLPFSWKRGSQVREGKASAEGRFRLDAVPAGTSWIWASIPGIAKVSGEVTVPAGGVATIDLDVRTEMSKVSGKVVLSTGEPLANLDLAVRAKEKDWGIGIRTNERGEFETMTSVATGQPIVIRIQRGSEMIAHEARGGDTGIAVVLEPISKVLLRVIAADTKLPVDRFEIRLRRAGESEWVGLGTNFERRPDDVTEIAMAPGSVEIEVDHDLRFFAPTRIVAVASPSPQPLFVEIARAITGVLRIEYVAEGADSDLMSGIPVFRPAGSTAEFRILGSVATLRTEETFSEYSIPAGTFEIGFASFTSPPKSTVTRTIAAGDTPLVLRVLRRKP